MTQPPPSGLAAAARQRTEYTRQRAIVALRQLDRDGTPITYSSLATTAGVSRSWLYRQPDLRAEIDRLRTRPTSPAVPAAQRASNPSQAQRISDLIDTNRAHHEQNRKLQDQIASSSDTNARRPETPVKDMSPTQTCRSQPHPPTPLQISTNAGIRLVARRAWGFHTAKAAAAMVMLTHGPITLTLPHEK